MSFTRRNRAWIVIAAWAMGMTSGCGIRARYMWESEVKNAEVSPGFGAASGGGVVTGGSYKIKGTAGAPDGQPVLTGGSYKLYPGPIHAIHGH
ncbi:MAG: hypothetical protein JNL01_00860 [Bdellovibrionales bacterium]|nr:hypothetical protein [Bdellovibrionales bacterium]